MSRMAPCAVILISLLSACGEIPQPFRHEGTATDLARPRLERGLVVPPVTGAGLSDDAGRKLAQAMVDALEDAEIPAVVSSSRTIGEPLLGEAVRDGDRLVVTWSFHPFDDGPETRRSLSLPANRLAGTGAKDLKRWASDAVPAIIAVLRDPNAGPAVSATADPVAGIDRPKIRIIALTGLPGDGDQSLAKAIRQALIRGAMAVVDTGEAYVVRGKVDIGPGKTGEDNVDVTWTISRASDMALLGSIHQEGAVLRGQLSGPWGGIARDIAEAGASGLLDVVHADQRKH